MTRSSDNPESPADQSIEPATIQSVPVVSSNPFNAAEDHATEDLPPLPGWPAIAKLISITPGFEAFQAFRDLEVKSLLYYQAELTILRKKLQAAEYEDYRRSESEGVQYASTRNFAKNLDSLILSQDIEDPKLRKQWTLITQIREVLKEYNAAILQYSKISALSEADTYNVESLRCFLKNMGADLITGSGADTWGRISLPEDKSSPLKAQFLIFLRSTIFGQSRPAKPIKYPWFLITPRPRLEIDPLTQWMANSFLPFYLALRKTFGATYGSKHEVNDLESGNGKSSSKGKEPDTTTVSRARILETLTTYDFALAIHGLKISTTTVAACLLPILAIVVLANLDTKAGLLGAISGFTVVFATGLIIYTNATRVEVFTATAAFSAVMVVFVQGAGSST